MNRTQAMEFDGQIRKHLEEYSLQNGLNPTLETQSWINTWKLFQILQSGR